MILFVIHLFSFQCIALVDFYMIQKNLPYTIAQNIGMALGKLKMIEDGKLSINTDRGRKHE